MRNIKENKCKCPDCGAILDEDRYCAECGYAGESFNSVITLTEALSAVSNKFDHLLEDIDVDIPVEDETANENSYNDLDSELDDDLRDIYGNPEDEANFDERLDRYLLRLDAKGKVGKYFADYLRLIAHDVLKTDELRTSVGRSYYESFIGDDAIKATMFFLTTCDELGANSAVLDLVEDLISPWYDKVMLLFADVTAHKLDDSCSVLKMEKTGKEIYGISMLAIGDVENVIYDEFGNLSRKMSSDLIETVNRYVRWHG